MRRWLPVRQDLGLQLFALYLLVIVPFLGASLAFDQVVGRRIRQEVEANDLSLARAIAAETELTIDRAAQAVSQLAVYPSVANAEIDGMAQLFETVLRTHPDVNLVYRLDADGIMLYHYPTGPGSTLGTDFSFRPYFQDALKSRGPIVSEGRVSPTTNEAVATTVMPIWIEADFQGLVATNIRLVSLSETLTAIATPRQAAEGFEVMIMDSSGQIIAAPDAGRLLQPASRVLPSDVLGKTHGSPGSLVTEDSHGVQRLYTLAPISGFGWSVAVSRPTSLAFASQITLHRLTLGGLLVFLAVGLIFWRVLSRTVIGPIERLAPVSESIGLNRTIEPEERLLLQGLSQRGDQIGHLVRSIFRMEAAIKDRMREQATLLETSTAVVSSLDLETVLDRILEQVERLLKVPMSAVIVRDAGRGVFRVRASRGLSAAFAEQLSIQPNEPSSVAMRALHSREPIQVSDTETDPSYKPQRHRARAEGFRALLGVPFNTQHAPATVLLVYHREPHIFSENEIAVLVSFANQATMALENAVLYSGSDTRLQEQTRRLEALVQSLSDGLVLSDLNGLVVYANRRIEELTGLPSDRILRAAVAEVVDAIVRKAVRPDLLGPSVRELLETGNEGRVELSLISSGQPLYLRLETFTVTDSREISIGRGFFFHDISAESELDRMRSSLVSTVSHELRTPLAAIKGYTTTLLADDVQWDRRAQREFLNIISDETDRLSSLVNNLLDLSRIEAGSLRLERAECDLDALIRRASQEAHLNPSNRLEVAIAPGLPPLYADPPRLETVLRNLIENSVKYAGQTASITVGVAQIDGHAVFSVTDDGPGIPEEQRHRVFDSFYQIDEGLTRAVGGAGLGLAICQGFVHAHGGRIWVEPRSTGTAVSFSIPLRSASIPLRNVGEPLDTP